MNVRFKLFRLVVERIRSDAFHLGKSMAEIARHVGLKLSTFNDMMNPDRYTGYGGRGPRPENIRKLLDCRFWSDETRAAIEELVAFDS